MTDPSTNVILWITAGVSIAVTVLMGVNKLTPQVFQTMRLIASSARDMKRENEDAMIESLKKDVAELRAKSAADIADLSERHHREIADIQLEMAALKREVRMWAEAAHTHAPWDYKAMTLINQLGGQIEMPPALYPDESSNRTGDGE